MWDFLFVMAVPFGASIGIGTSSILPHIALGVGILCVISFTLSRIIRRIG